MPKATRSSKCDQCNVDNNPIEVLPVKKSPQVQIKKCSITPNHLQVQAHKRCQVFICLIKRGQLWIGQLMMGCIIDSQVATQS